MKPIIVIDDDTDDLDMFKEVCADIGVQNQIIAFSDAYDFIDYIKASEEKFYFILCDVNMAKCSGLELKKIILADEHLRLKCVPFIFWSTSSASPTIKEAYSYNVQGYFVKPIGYDNLIKVVQSMVDYWGYSENPNQ